MLALVVLGGSLDPPLRLEEWRKQASLVVAADSGAAQALQLGLVPDVIVGDMDSIDPAVLARLRSQGVVMQIHRTDKDETDAELAVRLALERGATELVILCALGGRIDHSLANVLMLAAPGLEERAVLASGPVEVRLLRTEATFTGSAGDILSLLPLGDGVVGVRTDGLAYPLIDEPLPAGFARGVSNVFLSERAVVRTAGGALLAIHIRQTGSAEE